MTASDEARRARAGIPGTETAGAHTTQTGRLARPSRKPDLAEIDFMRQPFVLAWELTPACNLACVHCRADAQLRRDPRELSTAEALRLIDDIAGFAVPPVLILTGGDPLRRPDLLAIIRHARERGLRVTLTPAGTPLASRARLAAIQEAGVARLAVSLDGATAATHDAFRRVPGSFVWTRAIIQHAHDLGLPVQIHTTLCRQTLGELPQLADLADELGAVVWAIFCLIPIGRGSRLDALTPTEYEDVAGSRWRSIRPAPAKPFGRAVWGQTARVDLPAGIAFAPPRRVVFSAGTGAIGAGVRKTQARHDRRVKR